MSTGDRVPQGRAARLRRQAVALAKAAGGVLRSDERAELAFTVLAAPAMDALGLLRVSLWECVEGRLEFRAAQPLAPLYAGTNRNAAIAPPPARSRRAKLDPRVARIDDVRDMVIGDFRTTMERSGTHALLDVTVEVAGARWGQMVFESAEPRRWHADELASAAFFADVFGVALERERRRRAETQLSYLGMYDPVSGVANRALFIANLEQRLRRPRHARTRAAALLFIGIDRFQSLNEFFGEQGGNRALAVIADRINAVTPEDSVIGRLESDCFGVLLPAPAQDWHVTLLADALLESMRLPIEQDGRSWEASASIGIAFESGEGPASAEEWLGNSDLASKEAKASGRNRTQVFNPEEHQTLLERLRIEQGLRRALREGGIEVAYQGEFDLNDGSIVGAEALARWRTPGGELIAASDFIDVAEATGLIEPIGRIVLEAACREATSWPPRANGLGRVVRVNVSARQFSDPALVREIEAALASAGLPADRLCVEITETTVMTQAEEALVTLRALKALGVQIAIDDFGTGYSSLAYLRRFPVDALKLDKSMVVDVETDATVQAILRAVQSVTQALGLELVVEGVELPSQEAALRQMGIHKVQGFLHARPEPAAIFRARL